MKRSFRTDLSLEQILLAYLRQRPLFLSLIRSKEAYLYQQFAPLTGPVLDVGCGDGFFASIALRGLVKGPIIGLDLADSRIAAAGESGIYDRTVTFDGTHIPFPQKHFSTVVSNCVLEHVADLDPLLCSIHRVLKPGGVFLTTVMARPWEDHLAGSLLMGNAYKSWMRRKQVHLNLFSDSQWVDAFSHAGFQVEKQIGYLSPAVCRLIDIAHYLSVPSLLTYVLWGKWVLHPALVRIYPVQVLKRILAPNVPPNRSGALFFVLHK